MAGGKETPRQKMIGMMYLVLTALLALNVSKEILNSFILINDSLIVTNKNFTGKNQSQYDAFGVALANDEQKVRPFYTKAMQVKGSADSLYQHIELLKQKLIERTDKLDSTAINQLRDAGEPEPAQWRHPRQVRRTLDPRHHLQRRRPDELRSAQPDAHRRHRPAVRRHRGLPGR